MKSVLEFRNVSKSYSINKQQLNALDEVAFSIQKGEIFAVVGESGCGKSTLAKLALALEMPTQGTVFFDGIPLSQTTGSELRALRRRMQMVFQDPYASLNPRMTVETLLREPLTIHNRAYSPDRLIELLHLVGLGPEFLSRYPHALSGGQRQRVTVARALAVEPEFLVLDEPLSALDIKTQKQLIGLFKMLREKLKLTLLFISHDLHTVRQLADRVAVMYLGQVVEMGSADEILSNPQHPYTQALISALPIPDPILERSRQRIVLQGELPSPFAKLTGCPFQTRCPQVQPRCLTEKPLLEVVREWSVACHCRFVQKGL